MIKKLAALALWMVLMSSCVQHSRVVGISNPTTEAEIRDSVRNVTLIARDLRGNPDNVGGNENTVYEPSSYFSQKKPVWMMNQEISHVCLIAFIASDKDYNESNWVSFFHGIDDVNLARVRESAVDVSHAEYDEICRKYAYGTPIDYGLYKEKVADLKG